MKNNSAILQWIDKNKLLNSAGKRFEWTAHSFLIDPMCDWSRRITIKKSAQIGFSESFGILKAVFGCIQNRWNIIYTLPTDRFSETFVQTKFDPIMGYNSKLGDVIDGTTQIKKAHNRFIYFRGTHSIKGKGNEADTDKGISISSDLNIHDEMDRSDQNTIEQYGSRIENSDYGGIWSFSNPTYPGVGCDGLFEESDQKHWFVKCSHCGHRQFLDWIKLGETKNKDACLIDPKKEIFICSNCEKQITDTDRLRGEWVAKHPGREISGYWMSQLNYVKHHPVNFERGGKDGLLRKEKKTSKQHFYNFILGQPYRGTDEIVDRKSINQNITPHQNSKKNVAMGVDQGIWKHFVLGNSEGIFEVGKTKSWDVIEEKIRKFRAVTVIDAFPYTNTPTLLVKKYPGQVYMCHYVKDKDAISTFRFLKKKDRGVVKVQRTRYFDIMVEKFAQGEKPINIISRDLEEYITHWETLSRKDQLDSMGVMRGYWESSNKRDHYCHATLYQDVAMQKLSGRESDVGISAGSEEYDYNAIEIVDNRMKSPTIQELRGDGGRPDWRYV